MKITTYNPDGSIKEVRQHRFQVPEYITSFDSKRSFLNITGSDMTVLDFDDNIDIVKDKFLLLLDYDITNYINSLLAQEPEQSLIDILFSSKLDVNELSECNQLLHRFIYTFEPEFLDTYSKDAKLRDETKRIMDVNLMVELLLYNLHETRKRGIIKQEANQELLSLIHLLYRALGKCSICGFTPPKQIIHILRPFAESRRSTITKITNNRFLKNLICSLHSVEAQYRSELYRLLLAFGYRPEGKQDYNPSWRMLAFGEVNKNSNLYTVIGEEPSNNIEDIKAELEKEEIVAMYADCPVSDEYKQSIKAILNQQYEKFSELNGNHYRFLTEQKAKRFFRYTDLNTIIKKDWRELYFIHLDELESEYKHIHQSPLDLDVPLFYYYLLVEECECGKKYTVDDNLLNFLLMRILKRPGESKIDLYKQMYILNLLEINAKLISDENAPIIDNNKENSRWEEVKALRKELLNGNYQDIVDELRKEDYSFCKETEAIDYIMVWLEPLFRWHLNMKREKFEDDFRRLLQSERIKTKLINRRNNKNKPNFKLILNIIGVLSTLGKDNFNTRVQRRVGPSLERELLLLWKGKEPTNSLFGNYHKYVSGWDSDTNTTDLTTQDIKEIKTVFNI